MAKSSLDGTSDYIKLKKELEEYKKNKKISADEIVKYISELEKKANANLSYREKRENIILKKRINSALKYIDNALVPMYRNDVEILKNILVGDD